MGKKDIKIVNNKMAIATNIMLYASYILRKIFLKNKIIEKKKRNVH